MLRWSPLTLTLTPALAVALLPRAVPGEGVEAAVDSTPSDSQEEGRRPSTCAP